MKDLTSSYDYTRLAFQERQHFAEEAEITGDLRLGGIHAHDAWRYYWARTMARLPEPGLADPLRILQERFPRAPLRILSLGSGYCGEELALARRLGGRCHVRCTDLNGDLFEEARRRSRAEGLDFAFEELDLNFARITTGAWHLIFAHASLHHIINLEHLFDQIRRGLVEGGLFKLVEVIGQNRRLLWKENERFARRLLRQLPFRIRGPCRLRAPSHTEGMEGIRQQEILPLLHTHFTPLAEIRHGAFMRAICLHRHLGPRLDPSDEKRRRWLDWLIDADASAVRTGLLKPLEVWGLYEPRT